MGSGESAYTLPISTKSCPKDPFPLPHIDKLVDATAGHQLMSFMDAFSGYNQILMHHADQEKTSFMTSKGIYCYKVMPFGLKNAGSTYQRLVNMMFAEQIGQTIEVYIDNMLVRSLDTKDHISHLQQAFSTLRIYNMKLNPAKCSFGVSSGKFLGVHSDAPGHRGKPQANTSYPHDSFSQECDRGPKVNRKNGSPEQVHLQVIRQVSYLL